jgi:hypothetical protein
MNNFIFMADKSNVYCPAGKDAFIIAEHENYLKCWKTALRLKFRKGCLLVFIVAI